MSHKQPVIFLDIDGVLNIFDAATISLPPIGFEPITRFETRLMPSALELVNKLAEKYDALIVVSSTWRFLDKQFHKDPVLDNWDQMNFDLKEFLRKSGLKATFHADWFTPHPKRFGELLHGRPRGLEIKEWLDEHPDVDNWVALDDDYRGFNFDDYLVAHLSRTNPNTTGFGMKEYVIADKILGNRS